MVAAGLAAATVLAGCGTGSDDDTLTVLAAASLTETYTELAEEFERTHDDVEVELVLDSSAALAELATDQAPGDVLATADRRTMDKAREGGGTAAEPQQFATNELLLAVPADDPAGIRSFVDLQRADVDYLTCVETAPCGAAARSLLDAAGITHDPVSEEVDVKAVLAKVVDGEADAGLVYRTDVAAAGDDVTGLDVPGAQEGPTTYWIAPTTAARDEDLAGEWVDFVLGETGRQVLTNAGFGPPER